MLRALALVMVSYAAGCTPEVVLESSDVRLDGADDVPVDSTHARMCVSEAGHVYVVWTDDRTGAPGVYLNRSEDGGQTWRADPVRIDHHQAASTAPDVACASEFDADDVWTNDLVYVVWEDARDGELENRNVYLQQSWDGGATWLDTDRRVSADPDGRSMHLGPRVEAKNREVYVTWFDGGSGAFDIHVVASHTRGEEWKPIARVDGDNPGAAYSAWPDLATDGQGHVFVVWEDSRDGASDIYATSSSNGGFSFFPAVRLDGGTASDGSTDSPGTHDSFHPRIASNGPVVYVAWHDERNGANRDVYVNLSTDYGETWLDGAVRMDADGAGFTDSINPDVAVVRSADGGPFTGVVAWQDARTSGYDVFARTAPDGDLEAREEQRLDADAAGTGQSLNVRVAAEDDTIVVAWEDRRDDSDNQGYNEIYYNWSTDGGVTWSEGDLRIDNLASGTSYKTDLSVAVKDGVIHATWVDGRNGTADVYYHALPVGEEAQFIRVE